MIKLFEMPMIKKSLYIYFLDERKLAGMSDINKLIQKYGGWPMSMSLADWEEKSNVTWQQISDKITNDTFHNGLYDIAVTIDHKKSDSYIINASIFTPFYKKAKQANICYLFLYYIYIVYVPQLMQDLRSLIFYRPKEI